jgi:pantothenate synthetase
MIQAKILFLESELDKNPFENKDMLQSVRSLKELLNQIDFNAEVVPTENIKKLNCLFESLKKDTLTKQEKLLIKKIAKF